MRPEPRARAVAALLAVLATVTACSSGPDIGADGPGFTPAVPGTETEIVAAAGNRGQERQAELVAGEDDRIYAVSLVGRSGSTPYTTPAKPPSIVPTLVLTARPAPYTLASLVARGAARERTDGNWDLLTSVVVERGATLRLDAPGRTLHMASGTAGFTSIVAVKGTVELTGRQDAPMTVSSWDPVTGETDRDVTDGRSYLRAAGGRLELTDVVASDLGFWSARTGGVAWTGSQAEQATGSALRTVVTRSRYGMFAARTSGLTIEGGTLHDNEIDGLLVHRSSTAVNVVRTEASGNGRNGITVTAGASGVTLSEVAVRRNAVDGIRIDGAPRADPATPAGAAAGHAFTVERSVVDGNEAAGIVAETASGLRLVDNTVTGSRDGIVVRGAGGLQDVRGNLVEARDFGIAVRDGADGTLLVGNSVRASAIALQVADARADLRDNVVGSARHYAVSLIGNTSGSTVTANRFAGRGPAAIDTIRLAEGTPVTIGTNDDRDWTIDRDESARLIAYAAEHPLLWLWSLILLLPVAAGLWSRRRRTAPPAPAAEPAPEPTGSGESPDPPDDNETTMALPITRVTIVSQVDA